MLKEKQTRIRRLYGIALSAVIILAGICLMVQCVRIYNSGDFTREIVAEHFSPIAVPIYVCLAMVVIGFILELCLPGEKPRRRADKQNELILQRLHEKTDLSQCDEALRTAVLAQQKQRRAYRITRTALIILCSVVFLCYAMNGSNFGDQTEITPSMIRAMYVLLPCCLIPFGWAVFTAYHRSGSIQKEIDLLKQAKPNRSPAPKVEAAPKQDRTKLLRRAVLVIGIAVLVYGYFTGGTNDVLTKAVNICTECVGLG